MSYVEVEAGSIDEAIERALAQLGVTRDKVEVEILANSARGIFGLGGRKARVRATVRPALLIAQAEVCVEPGVVDRSTGEGEALTATAAAVPTATTTVAADRTVPPLSAVLQEIVRRMGVDVRVVAAPDGRLVINGDVSGVLIGRRGQTLDAIEYVINRIAARDEDNAGRIVVDIENYRERRQQALESMAKRLAERARRRGKPVTLSPMNPRDRRIVHMALQGDASLTTRSTGEGYLRRLVIVPTSRGNRRGETKPSQVREPRQDGKA